MAEKGKSDTSSTFGIPTPSIVVKNPLLSASVTGLTFDDFTNKPLLLPAAPPFIHSLPSPTPTPSPPPSHTNPSSRILNREVKSLVTVGPTPPSDIDNETLSEINLNSNVDESPSEQDTNANSLLSQAASSFSALPAVASTVFSTFSKRIYPTYSNQRENVSIDDGRDVNSNTRASTFDLQSGIQNTQQQQPTQPDDIRPSAAQNYFSSAFPTEPATSYLPAANPVQPSNNVLPPPPTPPKFYNPIEASSIAANAAAAPNSTTGQNTYRLTAKKKLYAPIPGFSNSAEPTVSAPTVDTCAISAPLTINSFPEELPPQPTDPQCDPIRSQYVPVNSEERKGGGGLFSLTNLVPTTVLQNISGLVQTAAGSITQTVRQDSVTLNNKIPQPQPLPQQQQQQQQQHTSLQINYFNSTNTNYPSSTSASYGQLNTKTPNIFPDPNSSDNLHPPSGELQQQQPFNEHTPHNYFVPNFSQELDRNTTSEKYLQELEQRPPQEATSRQPPTCPSQITKHPSEESAIDNSVQLSQPEQVKLIAQLPPPPPVIGAVPPRSSIQSITAEISSPFSPPQPSSTHQISQSGPYSVPSTKFTCPPYPPLLPKTPTSSAIPSSATHGGQHNFRLQKGTRLYKNPLSSAEILVAPSYVSPALGKASTAEQSSLGPLVSTSPLIFNPYAAPNAAAEQQPTLIVPEILPEKQTASAALLAVKAPTTNNPNTLIINEPLINENDVLTTNTTVASSQLNQSQSNEGKHLAGHKDDSFELTPHYQIVPDLAQSSEKSASEFFINPPCTSENSFQHNQGTGADPDPDPSWTCNTSTADAQVIEAVFLESPQNTNSNTSEIITKKDLNLFSDATFNVFKQATDLKEITTPTTAAASVPLPPAQCSLITSTGAANPYRKEVSTICSAAKTNTKSGTNNSQAILANFFTPSFNEPKIAGDREFPLQALNDPPSVSNTNFFNISSSDNLLDGKVAIVSAESSCSVAAESKSLSRPREKALSRPLSPVEGGPVASSSSAQSETTAEDTKLKQDFKTPQNTNSDTSITNFFGITSNLSNLEKQPEQNFKDSLSFFDTFSAEAVASNKSTSDPTTIDAAKELQIGTTITTTTTTVTNQAVVVSDSQQIRNFFSNPQEPDDDNNSCNLSQQHLSPSHQASSQERLFHPVSDLEQSPLSAHSKSINQQSSKKINSVDEKEAAPAEKLIEILKSCEDPPEEIIQALKMADSDALTSTITSYVPAKNHWFYKRTVGSKIVWTPFSSYDSTLIETNFVLNDEVFNVVAVEGGRFDVNIRERTKTSVYWEGKPIEVRRCMWFYKGTDSRYIPFEEHVAELLEAEYRLTLASGEWHKKVNISTGEQVVFHAPTVIVHFQKQQNVDVWGGSTQTTTRPRVVKRDLDDFSIEAGESQRVDHLLFVVHGIGAACDLKFRPVEEVVDDFRSIAQQLVSAHYKNSTDLGLVGRVEILPISWHGHLHSVEMGIDEKLKSITLESIPKLRHFANDTLLDVLFYTSPTFCQKIMNTVAASMNSVYAKYCLRHPDFNGGVSVAGHSLGSLILFDLLCHQQPPIKSSEQQQNSKSLDQKQAKVDKAGAASMVTTSTAGETSYTVGETGAGQPFINYVQLTFQPKKFFALGSPIGVFVTIRGIDKLGLDFKLPTCSGFYNIFHPFDPVAYRIEALVNPDMKGIPPVLIPHHKGRKRMHLELKDTVTRVGADLKQRFYDTFKNTLETVNFLGASSSSKENKERTAKEILEKELDKVLQMQMQLEQEHEEQQEKEVPSLPVKCGRSDSVSDSDLVEIEFPLGNLNGSKRIDYVLQEAPLEFFNEYLFALSSHVCYWESEDTILFVMKEIYTGLGINADSQLPPQTMTIERPSPINRDSMLPPATSET